MAGGRGIFFTIQGFTYSTTRFVHFLIWITRGNEVIHTINHLLMIRSCNYRLLFLIIIFVIVK